MRTTTYLGLLGGFVVVYSAVLLKGGDHTIFTNHVAALIALGGTLAATTLSCSRSTASHALSAARMLFVSRSAGARHHLARSGVGPAARSVPAEGAAARGGRRRARAHRRADAARVGHPLREA